MGPRAIGGGILGVGALLLAPLHAQTHQVNAPKRVTRAVAVYEWTGELEHPSAARLIPVSLFIDGHIEDAGVYLAQPIPFSLQPGDLYSVERFGQDLGAIEVESAQDVVTRTDTADDNPLGTWYGYGRYLTPAEENPTPRKAPIALLVVDAATDAPPVLRHRKSTSEPHKNAVKQAGFVTPPSTPLNDDPGRPILHHGTPPEADETEPLAATPPDMLQVVAISDAAEGTRRNFTRAWATATERSEVLSSLEDLARVRVAGYVALNNLTLEDVTNPALPDPASTGPAFANRSTAQQAELTNEELSAYTLSDGGLPTFIYTTESPVAEGGPVYLTLVAQRLPTGELHIDLASVTDAAHLDRTPWLRPIDAVDADASHSASLLFELRGQSSRQFVLYSLDTGQADQTFITGMIE